MLADRDLFFIDEVWRRRGFALLYVAAALILSLMLCLTTAQAQFLPGSSSSSSGDKTAMEMLMEEARKDGSTVIVVQPPKPDGAVQPSRMSTNHALEVREKVRAILASAPPLWPNIKATIFKEGRFGSFVWVLFGIGSATLGLVLAWLATRPVTRMLANYFRSRPPLADPETTADKARFLLIRAMVAVFITLSYLVVASLVAVA